MSKVFGDSKSLKQLIENTGWTLYDVSQPNEQGTRFKWDDLERQGSAKEFIFGNHYVFAPIPGEGQSLRDAYSITKGLGPALLIDGRNHERWRALEVTPKDNTIYWDGRVPDTNYVALFSRLSFDTKLGAGDEENVIAWTPQDAHPNADFVAIRAHLAIDTFQKYFRIAHMQNQTNN